MKRSFGLIPLFLLLGAPLRAQVNQDEVFVGPHAEKLIGEGKYNDAFAFLKNELDKNTALQTYSATVYAGLAQFFLEVGKPKDASEALRYADTISARWGLGNAFAARAQTAYLLAQADYGAAASQATKALRESSYRKERNIVMAYCRSLEALARLRSGDLKRAERLIAEALRDVPEDNDSEPLFASRVLISACLIESHRGNYEEAEKLYNRALEVLEKKKVDSRDVSLAQLAMAESCYLSGDLARSREFADKAMEQTAKLFRAEHQDTATALELLAQVDLKEAKLDDAETHARAALDMAVAVFGEGAGATKSPKKTLQDVEKAKRK